MDHNVSDSDNGDANEQREIKCPVCSTVIVGQYRTCERCNTPHHIDCWDYCGGCAIFACRCTPAERKELATLDLKALHGNANSWMFINNTYSRLLMCSGISIGLVFTSIFVRLIADFIPEIIILNYMLFPPGMIMLLFTMVVLPVIAIIENILRRRISYFLTVNPSHTRKVPRTMVDQLSTSRYHRMLFRFNALVTSFVHLLAIPAVIFLVTSMIAIGLGSDILVRLCFSIGLLVILPLLLTAAPILKAHKILILLHSFKNRLTETLKSKLTTEDISKLLRPD